jgi:hypothetical protein
MVGEGGKMKKLYIGKFNNRGEVLEEFVNATDIRQAYILLTARLAVSLGKTITSIRLQWNTDKNNMKIEEVTDGNYQRRTKSV